MRSDDGQLNNSAYLDDTLEEGPLAATPNHILFSYSPLLNVRPQLIRRGVQQMSKQVAVSWSHRATPLSCVSGQCAQPSSQYVLGIMDDSTLQTREGVVGSGAATDEDGRGTASTAMLEEEGGAATARGVAKVPGCSSSSSTLFQEVRRGRDILGMLNDDVLMSKDKVVPCAAAGYPSKE